MSFERIKNWKILAYTRNWYGRFERPISSLSLIGGFVFDAIVLRRVDMFWENFWVVVHILIVGTCIVLINREDKGIDDEKNPEKIHFWLVNIVQFFFGGILSTYLVFYFRSGSLSVSWPFILILALAFWANEAFKTEYVRLSFQTILFYLSLFAFAIFLVPVVLHQIGPQVFIISGIVSLVAMAFFLAIVSYFTKGKIKQERKIIFFWIGVIFVGMNILYFNDLIPPIPLSLKDAGVYHSLTKDVSGNYVVQVEKENWWSIFSLYDNFHATAFDTVYVYSAVFSPPLLNITIIHEWQHYDQTTKKWTTEGTVPLSVIGGRDGGFRTYSLKTGLTPGRWRVNVQTQSGQTIGTIRFTIVPQTAGLALQTETK